MEDNRVRTGKSENWERALDSLEKFRKSKKSNKEKQWKPRAD